jgi:hypothetical protein
MNDNDKIRKQQEEEEAERNRKNREAENRRLYNSATGDMLNTGIPGGVDLDPTTPW